MAGGVFVDFQRVQIKKIKGKQLGQLREPLPLKTRLTLRVKTWVVFFCVCAHVSFEMNSKRLPTLLFASTRSCLMSTGPISLNTLASSSSFSSSCTSEETKKNQKNQHDDKERGDSPLLGKAVRKKIHLHACIEVSLHPLHCSP